MAFQRVQLFYGNGVLFWKGYYVTRLSKGLQNVQYLSPQHQERDPGFTIVDPNDGSRIMSLGGYCDECFRPSSSGSNMVCTVTLLAASESTKKASSKFQKTASFSSPIIVYHAYCMWLPRSAFQSNLTWHVVSQKLPRNCEGFARLQNQNKSELLFFNHI